MSEWQPIETAPKDGTRVLITGGVWMDTRLAWPFDNQKALTHVEIAQYLEGDGFVISDFSDGTYEIAKPTHWMPLPAPPAAQ
jgi:hypothetical protein